MAAMHAMGLTRRFVVPVWIVAWVVVSACKSSDADAPAAQGGEGGGTTENVAGAPNTTHRGEGGASIHLAGISGSQSEGGGGSGSHPAGTAGSSHEGGGQTSPHSAGASGADLAGAGGTSLHGAGAAGSNAEGGTHVASPFQRGNSAEVRYHACNADRLIASSLDRSLAMSFVYFPDAYGELEECILAAESCAEVRACDADVVRPLTDLPACEGDPETSDRCEGNVAKQCVADDDAIFHEMSYDCDLVGGDCVEGEVDGQTWVECVVGAEDCKAKGSRCEDHRAIVCMNYPDRRITLGAAFDCEDAFGATCALDGGWVGCEGDALN